MDEELEVADLEKTAAREALVADLVEEESGRASLVTEIVDMLDSVRLLVGEVGTVTLADWVNERWQEQYASEVMYKDMNDTTYYAGLRSVMCAVGVELVTIWERG